METSPVAIPTVPVASSSTYAIASASLLPRFTVPVEPYFSENRPSLRYGIGPDGQASMPPMAPAVPANISPSANVSRVTPSFEIKLAHQTHYGRHSFPNDGIQQPIRQSQHSSQHHSLIYNSQSQPPMDIYAHPNSHYMLQAQSHGNAAGLMTQSRGTLHPNASAVRSRFSLPPTAASRREEVAREVKKDRHAMDTGAFVVKRPSPAVLTSSTPACAQPGPNSGPPLMHRPTPDTDVCGLPASKENPVAISTVIDNPVNGARPSETSPTSVQNRNAFSSTVCPTSGTNTARPTVADSMEVIYVEDEKEEAEKRLKESNGSGGNRAEGVVMTSPHHKQPRHPLSSKPSPSPTSNSGHSARNGSHV